MMLRCLAAAAVASLALALSDPGYVLSGGQITGSVTVNAVPKADYTVMLASELRGVKIDPPSLVFSKNDATTKKTFTITAPDVSKLTAAIITAQGGALKADLPFAIEQATAITDVQLTPNASSKLGWDATANLNQFASDSGTSVVFTLSGPTIDLNPLARDNPDYVITAVGSTQLSLVIKGKGSATIHLRLLSPPGTVPTYMSVAASIGKATPIPSNKVKVNR